MRRAVRHASTLFSALSLLLCVAALALMLDPMDKEVVVFDGGGGFQGGSAYPTVALVKKSHEIGLGWTHSDVWFERGVIVPLWIVASFAAVLPLFWLLEAKRRRNAKVQGHCPACGYDLRAHTAGGRCPECGAGIAAAGWANQ